MEIQSTLENLCSDVRESLQLHTDLTGSDQLPLWREHRHGSEKSLWTKQFFLLQQSQIQNSQGQQGFDHITSGK